MDRFDLSALFPGMTAYGSDDPLLAGLREEAQKDRIPIARPQTAGFLAQLTAVTRPERILEVGTAIGYSTIVMAKEMPPQARITTIENYAPRIARAKENFRRFSRGDSIELLEGNAEDILPALAGPFDLIFMDAAKGQYIHFLPHVLRLLAEGGVLVSDNIFLDGEIFQERQDVIRRDRTMHTRMQDYVRALYDVPELLTSILPLEDGVAVSFRRRSQ